MFDKRSKSIKRDKCFGSFLEQWQRMSTDHLSTKIGFKYVVQEEQTSNNSFGTKAKNSIRQALRQIIFCLEQFPMDPQFLPYLPNLVQHLSSLELSTKEVLQTSIAECYNFLRQLNGPTANGFRPLVRKALLNLEIIVKRLLRPARTYILYLKEKRQISRNQKGISFSALVAQFSQEKVESLDNQAALVAEKQVVRMEFYTMVKCYIDETKASHSTEICRICQQQIFVDEIYGHVIFCEEKHTWQQKLRENTNKIHQLTEQIRSIQVSMQAQLKKRRRNSGGIEPTGEDLLKLQHRFFKKAVRHLEQSLNKSRFSTVLTNQQIINLAELQKMYSSLKLIDPVRKNFSSMAVLLTQRLNIKAKLKKIDMKWRENQEASESIHSLNSLQQRMQEKQLANRHNISIRAISLDDEKDQQDIAKNKRRLRTNRKMHTFHQCVSSFKQFDDDEREYYSERYMEPEEQPTGLKLKDFQILKFLGKGSFGRVYLVRRNVTKDLYAMKIVKIINQSHRIDDIMNELGIFRRISGNHFVKAAFSFTEGNLQLFFLQYMQGGDMAGLIDREVYLSEQDAKFYIAEIVEAIEQLHKLGIIHRDLKPQNLVFDREGHLKLTDFGLSKEGINMLIQQTERSMNFEPMICQQNSTNTLINEKRKNNLFEQCSNRKGKIIGTPDYIPPEILKQESTENLTIDWWSLGVIIYQVLVGQRPFGSQTIEGVFDNILNRRIEWPQIGYAEGMMTPEAYDIINRLLDSDYEKRLGGRGADEIKNHPFFKNIKWNDLLSEKPPLFNRQHQPCILQQNPALRQQIQTMKQNDGQRSPRLNIDGLIRLDLLSEQTIRSGQKTKSKMHNQLANFFINLQRSSSYSDSIVGDCY